MSQVTEEKSVEEQVEERIKQINAKRQMLALKVVVVLFFPSAILMLAPIFIDGPILYVFGFLSMIGLVLCLAVALAVLAGLMLDK